jgi:phosphogluconate dehydratase
VRVDAERNLLTSLLADGELAQRPALAPDLSTHQSGFGRELFSAFRTSVNAAEQGADVWSSNVWRSQHEEQPR